MPILEIQIIGPVPEEIRAGLAQRIADAAAEVFRSRPQATWVTLHFVPPDAYAENAGGPPLGTRPVLASVLLADRPPEIELAGQAERLTEEIARACGRPAENVHIVYEPSARGRIAFGGQMLR
jgi:phenylpyruvate tautomerase PptA (4-oxalocrotonate tautomerase family)